MDGAPSGFGGGVAGARPISKIFAWPEEGRSAFLESIREAVERLGDLFGDDLLDAHAHLFPATVLDYLVSTTTYAHAGRSTELLTRTDWLAAVAEYGLKRMLISPQLDSSYVPTLSGDYLVGDPAYYDQARLDEAAALAAREYPDLLFPLLRGFIVGDMSQLSYVEDQLATGRFYGIGELFFHGHAAQVDAHDEDAHVELFKLAGSYGVPVLVHWDMLTVETDSATTGQENYEQLRDLLDRLDAEGADVNVIIAHVGAGAYDPERTPEATVDDWYTNILTPLQERDNVFFDVGGMQLGSPDPEYAYPVVEQLYRLESGDLTRLGETVRAAMEASPERFLLGTDVETRSAVDFTDGNGDAHHGTATYADSIDYYRTFLSKCSLTTDALASIRIWNAEDLYGLP